MTRFIIGLLLVFGAVGGMDVESAPIVVAEASRQPVSADHTRKKLAENRKKTS